MSCNSLQIHDKTKYIPKSHLWLIQKNVTELFDNEIIQTSHMRQNNFLIHLESCHMIFNSFKVKSYSKQVRFLIFFCPIKQFSVID